MFGDADCPRTLQSVDRFFCESKTDFEIIRVCLEGPTSNPHTLKSNWKTVNCFQSAFQISRFPQLALLDSVNGIQPKHWDLLRPSCADENFGDPSPGLAAAQTPIDGIRTLSLSPARRSILLHCLLAIYSILAWLLLGIRKHGLNPGLILISKSALQRLEIGSIDSRHLDAPVQILALAKLESLQQDGAAQLTFEEYQFSTTADSKATSKLSGPSFLSELKVVILSTIRLLRFWFTQLAFPKNHQSINPEQRSAFGKAKTLVTATVLVVACCMLLANRGYPLLEPDETRNAQLALNTLQSGDWLSLKLYGENYTDKPPLLAWLTASCYSLFGVNESAARLPPAIAGIMTIALTLILGSRLVGYRSALAGSISLLACWGFVFQARYLNMDALLTCCTTAAILSGLLALGSGPRRWIPMTAAGAATGLGVMAKGPVAIVIVVPIIALAMAINVRIPRRQKIALMVNFVTPLLAIGLPWFIVASVLNPEFAYDFFYKHHFVRFSNAFVHKEPFWYYAVVLTALMFPVSFLFPRLWQFLFSSRDSFRQHRTAQHGLLAIGAAWIVGFFSLSECKLPAYVLPALPLLGLLIGSVIQHWIGTQSISERSVQTSFHRLSRRIAIGMSGMAVTSSIVILCCLAEFQLPIPHALLAGIALVILCFVAVRRSCKPAMAWLATGMICMMVVGLTTAHFVPKFASQRSILSGLKREAVDLSVPIIYFGRDSFASNIYLPGHNVVHIREEELDDMQQAVESMEHVIVVASDENIERLTQLGGLAIDRLESRHSFEIIVQPDRSASLPDSTVR